MAVIGALTPTQIDHERSALDNDWKSTRSSVNACELNGKLDWGEAAAFRRDFDTWKPIGERRLPGTTATLLLGPAAMMQAYADYDEIQLWKAKLSDWQDKIIPKCKLDAPKHRDAPPPPPPPPGSWDWTTWAKIGAGLVGLGLVAYMGGPLIRGISSRIGSKIAKNPSHRRRGRRGGDTVLAALRAYVGAYFRFGPASSQMRRAKERLDQLGVPQSVRNAALWNGPPR